MPRPRFCWQLIVAVSLVVCAADTLSAAPWTTAAFPLSSYVHQAWDRRAGLPQDAVTAVLQTRDGFMWLGTQEGLVRFDGVRFTSFNRRNTAAFSHNEITALAGGPDGTLWIGTYGGLVEYRDGQFAGHPAGRERQRDAIVALAVDPQGAVWIGTEGNGVSRYAAGVFEFVSTSHGLASDVVNDVAVDRAGDVYVATAAGVSYRHESRWTTYGVTAGLPAPEAWRVLPAADGRVWVATRLGLAVIDRGAVLLPPQPRDLAAASIRSLALDRQGALWAGTEAGVAWRRNGSGWSSLALSPKTAGNYLWSIAEDREGSMWIGTFTSGLHRLWRGPFSSLTRRDGVPDDSTRAVLQTRNGDVWVATEATGLSRVDAATTTNFGTREGLPHLVVRALFEDAKGVLWAGTRAGLARFDRGRFHLVPATADVNVRALAEDRDGVLWVGTASAGLYRLSGGTLTDLAGDGRTRLPRGVIRSIARDHAGAMWVGTDDGLVRWALGTATVFDTRNGLPGDPVYAIHEDADHVLWLGTYGGGLVRLKNGQATRYTASIGLFDDVVYQVLEDGAGNLWMHCNNGVFRVAKSQLDAYADGTQPRITSVAYDTADGLPSAEGNGNAQPAGWKTADGRLWFPTAGGVAVVEPGEGLENGPTPLVALVAAAANGRAYPIGQPADVPPGAGRLEFDYAGLSFLSPERVTFRYRLEGFEADWVDAGARRQTTYTNLPPGRYVFHVSARNGAGAWSEDDARLALVLRPQFYQTASFRGVAAAMGFAALLAVVRLRDWWHRLRERELARRVEHALGQVKMLSGLIPICANCKKIRDDRGYWNELEKYLLEHSEAVLTHGICPGCITTLYPELASERGGPADTR